MRAAVRMCARCGEVTTVPVLVAEVNACDGRWNVYACQACAPHYPTQADPAEPLLGTVRQQHRRGGETER